VLALLGAAGVGAGMWLESRQDGGAPAGPVEFGPLLIIGGIVLVAAAVVRLLTSPRL